MRKKIIKVKCFAFKDKENKIAYTRDIYIYNEVEY